MPLVIFDIDGTLTDTTGVDDECFAKAIKHELGVAKFDTDWSNYPHATDWGLADEIMRRAYGAGLDASSLHGLRTGFVSLLRKEAAKSPDRFAEVPGARQMFLQALKHDDWHIAIATGAWKDSATLKLDTARIAYSGLPIGTSDDSRSRAQIVLRAVVRSISASLKTAPPAASTDPAAELDPAPIINEARRLFGTLAYVGDGVWDCKTAHALGIGFVGVRAKGDFDKLRALGAEHLLTNYLDPRGAIKAMADALR